MNQQGLTVLDYENNVDFDHHHKFYICVDRCTQDGADFMEEVIRMADGACRQVLQRRKDGDWDIWTPVEIYYWARTHADFQGLYCADGLIRYRSKFDYETEKCIVAFLEKELSLSSNAVEAIREIPEVIDLTCDSDEDSVDLNEPEADQWEQNKKQKFF